MGNQAANLNKRRRWDRFEQLARQDILRKIGRGADTRASATELASRVTGARRQIASTR